MIKSAEILDMICALHCPFFRQRSLTHKTQIFETTRKLQYLNLALYPLKINSFYRSTLGFIVAYSKWLSLLKTHQKPLK